MENRAKVVAITNQKGGVSKTTTATTVAILAAVNFKKKTLIIDTDQQANATDLLFKEQEMITGKGLVDLIINYDSENIDEKTITISHLLMNKTTVKEAIYKTEYEGLDIIPADIQLNIAKRYISSSANHLKRILKPVLNEYDLIIIDTPPTTDNILANVLNIADMCYIPIQPEKKSILGMMQTISFINQLYEMDNPNINYKFFVAMADKRISLHREFIEEIEKLDNDLNAKVFNTIPGIHRTSKFLRRQNAVVDNVFNKQQIHFALVKGSKRSKLADEYYDLAKEIIGGEQ